MKKYFIVRNYKSEQALFKGRDNLLNKLAAKNCTICSFDICTKYNYSIVAVYYYN